MKKYKLVKMATGGLMSQPPYIAAQDKTSAESISPYDVNTPSSARQGLPSRAIAPDRTRLKHGGMLGRLKFQDAGLSTKEIIEMNEVKKLEAMQDAGLELTPEQEQKIEAYKAKQVVQSNKPQMALGGMVGVEKGKYDQRPDYQAYAEGDVVEDMKKEDMNMEDEASLLEPAGMNEEPMEEEIKDEDMGDYEAIIDTSALSEEEEKVLDDAIEMHPELESILPKIVATEFTKDGEVEGPGTGTSDSIPALLSDGEFVFTAKAVKHIGVDKLRKMMKQAEEAYDAGIKSQADNQEIV
jgi:hypothetical protein